MKKHYIIFTFFVFAIFKPDNAFASQKITCLFSRYSHPANDTLITQLSAINLSQFQGQPVDSLLAHLPPGYIMMKIGGWRSQRLAEVLYIVYPDKVSVDIHVRNFQFMNPHLVNTPTPTQNWDISLFRKEPITFAIIFNGSVCINGCINEYK